MTTLTASDSSDMIHAIKRSISHNEIVRVTVPNISDGEQWVSERSESYGSTKNDCMLDIWGDDGQGGVFRLYLVAEGAE